ncbi:peptidase family C78-domain-containing protein [Gongronella butleri]|nr:peptidase family C78-domain-containing protein [Gongronella butleri]
MASSDCLSSAPSLVQPDTPLQDSSPLLAKRKQRQVDMLNDQDTKRTARHRQDASLWLQVKAMNQSSRTAGVIPRLEPHFTRLNKKGKTVHAYLCSALTDHISTGLSDLGWGCGYRNTQMLMSFLERTRQDGQLLLPQVCDIAGLQILLEHAWQEGFDPVGAKQLQQHVHKTRKWIGTTEVYSMLAFLGIRSTILDFHAPSGPHNHHESLMDWIQAYFEAGVKSNSKKTVYMTNRPPLYLQHAGHSRTVIGIEILKDGKRNLILFDPGRRMLRSYRHASSSSSLPNSAAAVDPATSLPSPSSTNSDDDNASQDVVDVEEADDEDQKSFAARLLAGITQHTHLPANLLRPFRVDAKTIAKNKQYQVLVLGQVVDDRQNGGYLYWDEKCGYLLDDQEREARKRVTSIPMA